MRGQTVPLVVHRSVPANLPLCSGAGRHTHFVLSFAFGAGKSAWFQGREQGHGVSVQIAVQAATPPLHTMLPLAHQF